MARNSRPSILISILIICLTFSNCERLDDVTVDLKSDLDFVGSQSSHCVYVTNFTDGFCRTVKDSPNSGFWSSCANYCEITINVGLLAGGALPNEFRVVSYVKGVSGILRPKYRLTSGSPVVDLFPYIDNLDDWTTSEPYDISQIEGFDANSQILVRVSSNPIGSDVAVIDSVIFSFPPVTTTTVIPSKETTDVFPSTEISTTIPAGSSTEVPETSTIILETSSGSVWPETSTPKAESSPEVPVTFTEIPESSTRIPDISSVTELSTTFPATSSAIPETTSSAEPVPESSTEIPESSHVTESSSLMPTAITFESSSELTQHTSSVTETEASTSNPSPATFESSSETPSHSTVTFETSSPISESSPEIPQTSPVMDSSSTTPSDSTVIFETSSSLPESSPEIPETSSVTESSSGVSEIASVIPETSPIQSSSTVEHESSSSPSASISTVIFETSSTVTSVTDAPDTSTSTPETSTLTPEPLPETSTELLESSTAVPETSTETSELSIPTATYETSTELAESSSILPGTTTPLPELSTTTPGISISTATYETSTEFPESSSILPETTTQLLESSTETSTELPQSSTTIVSDASTEIPETPTPSAPTLETSTKMTDISSILPETSTVGLPESSSPETSSTVSEFSSTVIVITPSSSEIPDLPTSTDLPVVSSTNIESSSAIPETSTVTSDSSSILPESSTIEFESSTKISDTTVSEFKTASTTAITEFPPVTFEASTEGVCSSGIYCTATDRYNMDWLACGGRIATQGCPMNLNGTATWFCQLNGVFSGITPDYTNCSHDWIPEIEKEIGEGQPISPEKAAEYLDTIGDNVKSGGYFGHEIQIILGLIDGILNLVFDDVNINRFEILTDNAWTIFANVLKNKDPWNEVNEEMRSRTGSEFITKLEATSLGLSGRVARNTTFQDADSNYRKDFQQFDEFRVLTGAWAEEGKPITFPQYYSEQDSHIDLPSDWADHLKSENVTFVGVLLKSSYSNFILPGHLNNVDPGKNSSSGKIINGNVMGFSFGDQTVQERFNGYNFANFMEHTIRGINFSGDGVKITFQHDRPAWGAEIADVRRKLHEGETPKAVSGSSACVYWDPENLTWSSVGCTAVVSEEGKTICECNHLTSFALLMDVHNYIGKDFGLELLTLILCPISIICLAICIYIFSTVKSEKSLRNSLTRNLCICLLVGNLLMLFFVDKHYFYLSHEVCVASAVATHYVFLCAIFWMVMEGALIFKVLFLDVFGQTRDYLLSQHILAYGLPALIVGATGVTTAVRADQGYGNDSFCWLNGGYIWAFLGPTALILVLNLVILILSVRKAMKMKNTPQPGLSAKGESSLTWLKGCASLSVLLGLTWIFGYLMAVDHSTTANISAYIFTILNASQGIFLFVFHGVLNSKVRSALKRRLPARLYSGAGSKSTPTSHYATNYTDLSIGTRVRQSFSSLKNTLLRRPSQHSSSSSRS